MSWKQLATETRVWTTEELFKKEGHWDSPYSDPARWIHDFKEVWYSLIGEYEIEKDLVLFRFEFDESHREEVAPGTPHFQNVVMQTNQPQVILSEAMMAVHKKK